MLDRIFPGMPEGRVANIVREACGGDDGANIRRMDLLQAVFFDDVNADQRTEGAADTRGFQAMGKPGADVVALCQRENLRFVL